MKAKLTQLVFPLLLVIFSLVILRPLFSEQLLYTDDAELHAARVANYYLAVKQGQIPPRLAPNLDSGYGSSVLNFTYPLPYSISTLIYMALPVTIVLALNLTIIILVLSGVLGVYYLAQKFSLKPRHSALASLIYLTAPYTLINIYSRTALGEIAFFAVLPWVMWNIEHFMGGKKVKPIVSLALVGSLALLLLSHQTSLIISAPVLITYYLLRAKNKKQVITLIKRIIPLAAISLLITAWYWLPALIEKKFVILDRADTVTHYLDQFPNQWSFFFHKIKNLERLDVLKIVSIGYSNLLIILISLWQIIKNKSKSRKEVKYLSIIFFSTIILIMPFTRPLWLVSGLGQYIQYPWRLLSLVTLSSTLLFIHLTKNKLINNFFIGVILATSLLSAVVYAQPRGFQSWSDYELFEYFKTTTTFNEFQPIWAAEYTRHFPQEKVSLRVPEKSLYNDDVLQTAEYAQLKIQKWNGSAMSYVIDTEKPVEAIQKTYYFPGWELVVDGQKRVIQYQDEEFPGHITYSLDPGKHQIELKFTNNTPPRKIGFALTLIGALSLSGYLFWHKKNESL